MRRLGPWLNRSENAAALAVLVTSSTFVGELAAGLVTGSVAVIADALHGGVDLFTAVMAFFSIRLARRPPDPAHPFGHGKIEDLSATVESFFIMGGAVFVFYQGYQALSRDHDLVLLELGIGVVVVEMTLKVLVSQHMLAVARREGSIALEADAQHIRADILTSVGAIVGLVGVRLTGLVVLDPLAALLIAFFILRSGLRVLRTSFGGLIDSALSREDLDQVRASILLFASEVCDYHDVRSRRAGRQRLVDLHLVVPKELTVAQAHDIVQRLEREVARRLSMADVTVHIEPCDASPEECATARSAPGHLVTSARRGPDL